MLYSAFIIFIKVLIIGSVMALELTVSFPLVSLLLLFLYLRELTLPSRVALLVSVSLILSSFSSIHWSIAYLVFSLGWIVVELLRKEGEQVRGRVILVTLVVSAVIALLADIHVTTKSVVYALLFVSIFTLWTRVFVAKRSRQRLIEWISPGI